MGFFDKFLRALGFDSDEEEKEPKNHSNDEIDKAISNYLKALSVNSQFHIAYKKLAILFYARGDKDDAAEYITDYLEFDLPKEEKEKAKELLSKFSS